MRNRVMLSGCFLLVLLLVTGCGNKYLVFGTYTEFDVAGIEMQSTGDVSLKIGYDRGEVAHVPDVGQDGCSILGKFDSDTKIFSGFFVNEVFATGEAANIASAEIAGVTPYTPLSGTSSQATEAAKPLVVSTGTHVGFHTIFSLQEGALAPVDILLGYKRANFAIVPVKQGSPNARSVYADVVIGDGSWRYRAAELVGAPKESPGGTLGEGIIISQRIATGTAAQHLAKAKEIQNKFDMKGDLKTVNDLSKGIKDELNRINKDPSAFDKARSKLAELANIKKETIQSGNFLQTAQARLDRAGLEKLLAFMRQLPIS